LTTVIKQPKFLLKITRGRTVKHGVTCKTALLTCAAIVTVMALFMTTRNLLATTYNLDVEVLDQDVVAVDAGCEWQFQIRVTNPNERRVSVVAFELENVDDSTRGTLAQVRPLDSVDRTYRLHVSDCNVSASDRDPGRLTTIFKLTGSSIERRVRDDIG